MDYPLRPLQERMVPLLEAFDTMCRRHGLTYWIWAGTQLGAARHGGFIPWDDDMDVAMPREDYDRLVANASRWLPEPLQMVCAQTDSRYPFPFGKIQDTSTTLVERAHMPYVGGIYMDVFPVDGVPSGRLARWRAFTQYEYYKRILYLLYRDPYRHGRGPSSWIPLLVRRIYTLSGVQRRINRLLHRHPYRSAATVADYDDGSRGAMPRRVLEGQARTRFEGREVSGVPHPEQYLAQKYGPDYLTPPPGPKRRSHCFHYLDLDRPFSQYRPQDPS